MLALFTVTAVARRTTTRTYMSLCHVSLCHSVIRVSRDVTVAYKITVSHDIVTSRDTASRRHVKLGCHVTSRCRGTYGRHMTAKTSYKRQSSLYGGHVSHTACRHVQEHLRTQHVLQTCLGRAAAAAAIMSETNTASSVWRLTGQG